MGLQFVAEKSATSIQAAPAITVALNFILALIQPAAHAEKHTAAGRGEARRFRRADQAP
ncbi:hypothetical protein [Nocardia arizonensis]|uniref:hypothetical protein n=1 Tax=Nocardia arizonensis TaxID=1141647 RepID=UPI001EF742C0|nr:hypothetical protein [Nocardia arizonensis]